jgi:hypothetical protein
MNTLFSVMSLPRIRGGATSPMYTGVTMEARPTPSPTRKRPATRVSNGLLVARAAHITAAPTVKMNAATRIPTRLPMLSMRGFERAEETMHPTRVTDTMSSCLNVSPCSPRSFTISSIAPDTMPARVDECACMVVAAAAAAAVQLATLTDLSLAC